ncbi:MAG: transposase [Cyclobacteriaceae bacterium]
MMEVGKYYHVYNRSVNREALFKEPRNYLFFLDKYRHYCSKHLDTLSYCLMPNHFHLFVRVKADQEEYLVANAFKNLFISYAKAINESYGRIGSLFQNRYKRKEIDSDAYFSMIIAYIHLNPLRAGLAKQPEDWKYSSYPALIGNQSTQLRRKEVLHWFGGLDEFIKFHQTCQSDDDARKLLF